MPSVHFKKIFKFVLKVKFPQFSDRKRKQG